MLDEDQQEEEQHSLMPKCSCCIQELKAEDEVGTAEIQARQHDGVYTWMATESERQF